MRAFDTGNSKICCLSHILLDVFFRIHRNSVNTISMIHHRFYENELSSKWNYYEFNNQLFWIRAKLSLWCTLKGEQTSKWRRYGRWDRFRTTPGTSRPVRNEFPANTLRILDNTSHKFITFLAFYLINKYKYFNKLHFSTFYKSL